MENQRKIGQHGTPRHQEHDVQPSCDQTTTDTHDPLTAQTTSTPPPGSLDTIALRRQLSSGSDDEWQRRKKAWLARAGPNDGDNPTTQSDQHELDAGGRQKASPTSTVLRNLSVNTTHRPIETDSRSPLTFELPRQSSDEQRPPTVEKRGAKIEQVAANLLRQKQQQQQPN